MNNKIKALKYNIRYNKMLKRNFEDGFKSCITISSDMPIEERERILDELFNIRAVPDDNIYLVKYLESVIPTESPCCFDRTRMEEALNGEVIHAPPGMSREEKRAFILKHAK